MEVDLKGSIWILIPRHHGMALDLKNSLLANFLRSKSNALTNVEIVFTNQIISVYLSLSLSIKTNYKKTASKILGTAWFVLWWSWWW